LRLAVGVSSRTDRTRARRGTSRLECFVVNTR